MNEIPAPLEVSRALARAEHGAAHDVAEALLAATGEEPDWICVAATRVRDAGPAPAGRPGVVTYPSDVFPPVTKLCKNRCRYRSPAIKPRGQFSHTHSK
ncbi:MAG: hypothetical protein M3306_29160 [Actinomycetota bacterium]|nr:hypothetical protein [Actinomycetota bacterium]